MDIGVYISELSKSSENIIKIISENGVDIYPINELGLLKYPPQKSIVFIDLTINANEHLKWMSLNKVKENSYNVIVITPRNSELVAQAMHQGAIDYLHPPFSIQQIKNILNREKIYIIKYLIVKNIHIICSIFYFLILCYSPIFNHFFFYFVIFSEVKYLGVN